MVNRAAGGSRRLSIKRVYDPASTSDGRRILCDRLWPRGLSKAAARIDYWARDVAPSNALRVWYHHEASRWSGFQRRYFAELDKNPAGVAALKAELKGRKVTLLFGSKELERNNATALRTYLTRR